MLIEGSVEGCKNAYNHYITLKSFSIKGLEQGGMGFS